MIDLTKVKVLQYEADWWESPEIEDVRFKIIEAEYDGIKMTEKQLQELNKKTEFINTLMPAFLK